MRAIKNNLKLVKMKAKLLLCSYVSACVCSARLFSTICLNTLKTFFPESDRLKWGASYMPVRPVCHQIW